MADPKVIVKKRIWLRDEFTGESFPIEISAIKAAGRIYLVVKSSHFMITDEEEV